MLAGPPRSSTSRWRTVGAFVATLTSGVCSHGWLAHAANPSIVFELPDDPAWDWPATSTDAARFFQCWPEGSSRTKDSVVVWTDKTNEVLAFTMPIETLREPAYAATLRPAGVARGVAPIQLAGRGHVLRNEGAMRILDLRPTRLRCAPTTEE